ncbi:hypothetical protein [Corynebacterium sphenisci]|uniref:hypothetical protein n=1 Tax=Corynebacterium sphenisci TaxID=191493 RepID=UPI0012F4B41E|nr:hypothetical protein [Corynebacterium sphenisci]
MAKSTKPAFTDVSGMQVFAKLVEIDGNLRLKLLDENSHQIMLLNFYDARQLAAACETFLNQRYGRNFAEIDGHMSAADRVEIFDEELQEVEAKLQAQAEEEKARRAAEGR